jgi:GNAT superfamily N-acetyltransferase
LFNYITIIDNIVVHPEYRGRGLAREIMDALEYKAAEWGATQIKLTCSRPEVQAMYEKRGYQEKVSTKYYVKKI